jgi:uncharacterized membrane protein (DUF485 family)
MELIIGIAILAVVTVVPVMFAAKMLNAANTGFWICLVAVIISSVASSLSTSFIANEVVAFIVSLAVTAVVFSFVLGAKYIQSACISLLAMAIQYGALMLLASLGILAANA